MKTILTISFIALSIVSFSQQQVMKSDQKEPLKSEKKVDRGLIYATELRTKTLPLPKGIVMESPKHEEISIEKEK